MKSVRKFGFVSEIYQHLKNIFNIFPSYHWHSHQAMKWRQWKAMMLMHNISFTSVWCSTHWKTAWRNLKKMEKEQYQRITYNFTGRELFMHPSTLTKEQRAAAIALLMIMKEKCNEIIKKRVFAGVCKKQGKWKYQMLISNRLQSRFSRSSDRVSQEETVNQYFCTVKMDDPEWGAM